MGASYGGTCGHDSEYEKELGVYPDSQQRAF